MIRHIVFFSMKPEALERDGLANAHAMAEHFRRISKEMFESRQALTDYTNDPRHIAVRDFVRQVIDHRIVVDYDMDCPA